MLNPEVSVEDLKAVEVLCRHSTRFSKLLVVGIAVPSSHVYTCTYIACADEDRQIIISA
jgi:hypothetical protein